MRYSVYKKTFTEDGVDRFNLFSINWSKFPTNNIVEHKVTEMEVIKPYLIAYFYYNDINYTDVLFLINKIPDLFNLKVGMILMIPNKEDIDNFIAINS